MNKIEKIRNIFENIEKPQNKKLFIPKYKKGDNTGKYVSSLNHKQCVFLGQLISEDVGERYALLTTQRSYDIFNSKSKETQKFRELASDYWSWRREVLQGNTLISDPNIVENHDELVYRGNKTYVIPEKKAASRILENAGILNWKGKIRSYPIWFNDNKEAAFGSGWRISEDHKFVIDADNPNLTHMYGFIAYEKTQ